MGKEPMHYVFDIKFICPECLRDHGYEETTYIIGTIDGILSTITEVGWPICQGCGSDMKVDITK